MKQIIIITLLLFSMSAAYAGGSILLHVWSTDATSGPSNCDGIIDASEGCSLPMLN